MSIIDYLTYIKKNMPKIKNFKAKPIIHPYKVVEEENFVKKFQKNPGILFGLQEPREDYLSKLKELKYTFFAAHHFNHNNNFFDKPQV